MPITPPGGSGFDPRVPFGPHPASKTRKAAEVPMGPDRERGPSAMGKRNDGPTAAADAADREALYKMNASRKHAEEQVKAEEQNLGEIRDEYTQQAVGESARNEAALEAQKRKGYEQIRDLKRMQQAELSKTRREGETELEKIKEYYRNTVYSTEQSGKSTLQELDTKSTLSLDHERKLAQHDLEQSQSQHSEQMTRLTERQRSQAQGLKDAALQEYEKMKSTTQNATEDAREHFQKQFETQLTSQKEVIDDLHSTASSRIKGIREDFSEKLSAYSSRSRDPFYRMKTLDADLGETSDSFVLTATVPEHEQQAIAVSMKGSNLVISGYRRNEERLEVEPGHKQSSNSYQSFSESFALDWPVDARALRKEFDGDTLTVIIPKKALGRGEEYKPHKSRAPERARVERPQFPENLPHTKPVPTPDSDAPEPGPSRGNRGSRPLGRA